MPAEAACEKAIELGLDGIIFTDHLDYDFPNFDISFMIDFKEYAAYMSNLKKTYEKTLKVLMGIEVGIEPHNIKESEKIVKQYDFDFVIASTHIVDRKDPYTGEYYIGKTKSEAFHRYLEVILDTVTNFNDYNVVGHIGYIRRYGNYEDKSLRHLDYSDLLDSILKKVISDGKGIEINTSGYRSLGTPIPDFDIVKRYRELGGEILTIGSDAHYVDHMALNFKEVQERLKEIGFKYITHFEKRKPVFDKL
jgi:histidinol-phosphatase (PHP family)